MYANGFQMVATGPQSKQVKDAQIISMEVRFSLILDHGAAALQSGCDDSFVTQLES